MKDILKILGAFYATFFLIVVLGKILGMPIVSGLEWFTVIVVGFIPLIVTVVFSIIGLVGFCILYTITDLRK